LFVGSKDDEVSFNLLVLDTCAQRSNKAYCENMRLQFMHCKDIFTFKREWNVFTGPGGSSGKHKSCDMTCTPHLNNQLSVPLHCLYEAKMTKSLPTCYLTWEQRSKIRLTVKR
jgi:hypothetical protein